MSVEWVPWPPIVPHARAEAEGATVTDGDVVVRLDVATDGRATRATVTTFPLELHQPGVMLVRVGFSSLAEARAWAERLAPVVAAEERARLTEVES